MNATELIETHSRSAFTSGYCKEDEPSAHSERQRETARACLILEKLSSLQQFSEDFIVDTGYDGNKHVK